MMFDAQQWLDEVIRVNDFTGEHETPRHRRLCYLLVCNGCNMHVGGWGFMSLDGPGGHQSGLNQEEAHELMHYAAFMSGIEAAGRSIYKELAIHLEAYIAEFKALEAQEASRVIREQKGVDDEPL